MITVLLALIVAGVAIGISPIVGYIGAVYLLVEGYALLGGFVLVMAIIGHIDGFVGRMRND